MERFLLSAPSITWMEVAFFTTALLVLVTFPLLANLADRRRARTASKARLPEEFPVSPVEATPREERPASPEEPSWVSWPVTSPVPSLDPWHPEEESRANEAAQPGTVTVERASTSDDSSLSAASPVENRPKPPPLGAVREWLTPARDYETLPPLFAGSNPGVPTQMLALRSVTLATWPGPPAAWPADVQAVWQGGIEAYEQWKSSVLNLEVPLPAEIESYALGRIERENNRFRLHFLLFDQLWPTHPEEASAVCIVDLDPQRGPMAWSVVPVLLAM